MSQGQVISVKVLDGKYHYSLMQFYIDLTQENAQCVKKTIIDDVS